MSGGMGVTSCTTEPGPPSFLCIQCSTIQLAFSHQAQAGFASNKGTLLFFFKLAYNSPQGKFIQMIESNFVVTKYEVSVLLSMSSIDILCCKEVSFHQKTSLKLWCAVRDVIRKKTGLCGKNSQTGGVGLTQTHFLMSTYQVIFGMPKWFWGAKTCFTKRGEVISDQF